MINYETYKVIHLASIFIFLTSASVLLIANPPGKLWKMITGISSLLILVAGFGLLARLGMTGGIPNWAIAKIVIWLVVTGLGHMVAKRFPSQAMRAYVATLTLSILAAWLAVYKPV